MLLPNATKTPDQIRTELAALLNLPRDSLVVKSSAPGSLTIAFEGANSTADAALALRLTSAQLATLGAASVSSGYPAAPASRRDVAMVAGLAVGGFVLLLIILVLVKKNSSGGTGSDAEEGPILRPSEMRPSLARMGAAGEL